MEPVGRTLRTAAGKTASNLRENGWRWTAWRAVGRAAGRLGARAEQRSRALELRHGLPGANSVRHNREVWGAHDWSAGGEEWSESVEWRESVVSTFLAPVLHEGAVVLEIGPGGGRWTRELHDAASALYLVDITDVTLQRCRDLLTGTPVPVCIVGDGRSLDGVPDATVDLVWSFDAFVHIAPTDQESYLRELRRVLVPGGVAVIHHAGTGGVSGGWRSPMTCELFDSYAAAAGLDVDDRRSAWGPDGAFGPSVDGDVVTTLRRG